MHFVKMPQGFKNSPTVSQRMMSIVLEGLIGEKCIVYIDDILIFGETIKKHDENLKLVLERINEYGLQENREKRIEGVIKINFLWYNIEMNKITPCTKHAEGIVNYQTPKNIKSLQRFLGALNYGRIFV